MTLCRDCRQRNCSTRGGRLRHPKKAIGSEKTPVGGGSRGTAPRARTTALTRNSRPIGRPPADRRRGRKKAVSTTIAVDTAVLNQTIRTGLEYPHGESNPGFRTENPTSWATRRWGRTTMHFYQQARGCQADDTRETVFFRGKTPALEESTIAAAGLEWHGASPSRPLRPDLFVARESA